MMPRGQPVRFWSDAQGRPIRQRRVEDDGRVEGRMGGMLVGRMEGRIEGRADGRRMGRNEGRADEGSRRAKASSGRVSDREENDVTSNWDKKFPLECDYGEYLHTSPRPDSIRIAFLNVNGLAPVKCRGGTNCGVANCRVCSACEQIHCNKIDVLGISEVNLDWQAVPSLDSMSERLRGRFEAVNHKTTYYESWPHRSREQKIRYGGVSQWSINLTAYRVMEHSVDTRSLGRWVSVLYRGKDGITLRIVTAYCPVKSNGSTTVYIQQQTHFRTNEMNCCPIEQFKLDLCAEIEKWMQAGEQLIVGLDANEDLRNQGEGSLRERLGTVGLEDVIGATHGYANKLGNLATHARGSQPIDGVFASRTIMDNINACGASRLWPNADHRAVWIEIPTIIAFGGTSLPTVPPRARRLKCVDPRIVQQYIKKLSELGSLPLKELAVAPGFGFALEPRFANITYFQLAESLSPTEFDPIIWEQIDIARTSMMLRSERQCRKFRMGRIPWSPKLSALNKKARFLRLLRKRRNNVRVQKKYLARLRKAFPPSVRVMEWTNDEIRERLQEVTAEMNKCKADADNLRGDYLQELAAAQVAAGKAKEGSAVRNLLVTEQQRLDARIIRNATSDSARSGVSMITVPSDDGSDTLRQVTDKDEIETLILEEYEARLRQANGTPFTCEPLLSLAGRMGEGPAVPSILDGQFSPPAGTDEFSSMFLRQLEMADSTREGQDLEIWMSKDEYQFRWRRAREKTSSGNSGIHFGHFMANLENEDIAEIDRALLNCCLASGYSPRRWRNGLSLMIPKTALNFMVNKLRPILLFECDCNFLFKQMGRDGMRHSEKNRTIAPEQYGNRKNLSSIEHCYNKVLSHDLGRQRKTAYAMCCNDAKGCYDRIVHNVASICLQQQGIPFKAIVCMMTTLQQMHHHVRTIYGDSSRGFCAENPLWIAPIAGMGQGNGAAGQVWAIVSTPILNMLRAEGLGFSFKTAISGDETTFVGYSFVDDSDIIVSAAEDETAAEVVQKMQRAMDIWEGGLFTTGGALEPTKSFWYLIDFVWDSQGNHRYANIRQRPGNLVVKNADGERLTLERLESNEARRTLGAFIAPDGNNNEQIKVLKEKAESFRAHMAAGHIPKRLARVAFTTTISRSLSYPLVASTMNKKQVLAIFSPALKISLQKSGIAGAFPRVVVYGPIRYQGLGYENPFTGMIVRKIQALIRYSGKRGHVTGRLLRGSLEAMKVEIGCNGPVLLNSYRLLSGCTTDCWVKDLWNNLHQHSMAIIDDIADFKERRVGDRCLMEIFAAAGYKGDQLVSLNKCRLRCKIVMLSDIVTACGTMISLMAWNCVHNPSVTPPYEFPKQGIIQGDRAVKLWQEALKKSLAPASRKLAVPMGPWLRTEKQCSWFLDPTSERLYTQKDSQWGYHAKRPGSRTSRSSTMQFHSEFYPVEQHPQALIRATIDMNADRSPCLTGTGGVITPLDDRAPDDMARLIDEMPDSAKWAMLQCTVQNASAKLIAESIVRGDCVAVSDGSYLHSEKVGSACFIIEGMSVASKVTGKCVTPGEEELMSPLRSEVAGLYAIATALTVICKANNISSGMVTISCDCPKALSYCTSKNWKTKSDDARDLIVATRAVLAAAPFEVKPEHVKGHQDERGTGSLTRAEALNCEADASAKAFLQQAIASKENRQTTVLFEPWHLVSNGNKVPFGEIRDELTEILDGRPLLKHWKKRERVPSNDDMIDWDAVEHAMRNCQNSQRTKVSKHMAGYCGVNHVLARTGERPSAECPRCEHEDEDATHVNQCKGSGANEVWATSIERLSSWMADSGSDPAIISAIIAGLTSWREDAPMDMAGCSEHVHAAIEAQEEIGWMNLLEGRPSKLWRPLQEDYDRNVTKRTRGGKRWLSALIRKILDVSWDLWTHRNRIVHEGGSSVLLQQARSDVTNQIADGDGGSPEIRALLTNAPSHEGVELHVIRAWLGQVETAREFERRNYEARRGVPGQRRIMREFLNLGSV